MFSEFSEQRSEKYEISDSFQCTKQIGLRFPSSNAVGDTPGELKDHIPRFEILQPYVLLFG